MLSDFWNGVGVAVVGGAVLGTLAVISRVFLRGLLGGAELADPAAPPAHRFDRLGRVEHDVATIKNVVQGLDSKFDTVRKEREAGDERILAAVADHAEASAGELANVREDIGNLFGLLGKPAPTRRLTAARARPRRG